MSSPFRKLLLFLALIFIARKYKLYRKIIGYISFQLVLNSFKFIRRNRPKRIIILRHGQTTANLDSVVYSQIPDNQIPLTETGKKQAQNLGKKLVKIIRNESIQIYVSPFLRCKQTCQHMCESFQNNKYKIIEEPRIREQEWGNFQKFSEKSEDLKAVMEEREKVGKLYYRFDHGESGCDVIVRVSSFMETMFRFMDHFTKTKVDNIIIVTHGLTMRYFTMRYFNLKAEEFEKMWNPINCEFWIFENDETGHYKLKSEIRGYNESEFGKIFILI